MWDDTLYDTSIQLGLKVNRGYFGRHLLLFLPLSLKFFSLWCWTNRETSRRKFSVAWVDTSTTSRRRTSSSHLPSSLWRRSRQRRRRCSWWRQHRQPLTPGWGCSRSCQASSCWQWSRLRRWGWNFCHYFISCLTQTVPQSTPIYALLHCCAQIHHALPSADSII